MLILTAADLLELVPMQQAIEEVERAMVELSAGRTVTPLRTPIASRMPPGDTLIMPAAVPAAAALGAKIVTVFPENPAQGRPLIHAVVLLIDPATGEPLALLEGRALTALRTGAVSGVATRYLSRPAARSLTCFGAGVQAKRQIEAVCTVRAIERVVICSRGVARAEALAEWVRRDWPGVVVEVEGDPAQAAARGEIICTATTAARPVLPDLAVQPGTHINAIGAYTPAMAELPAELVARARVVVDQSLAARAEAGDLIQAVAAGLIDERVFTTELGQVVAGGVVGRGDAEQITLFKSVGNAVQDLVVARRAVEAARQLGRGQVIDLERPA